MSKSIFESEYKKLNKEQKRAVDTIEGPVMVVAGPGTGKTTLLTLRIANILIKTDASPENILALTFTNSGVSAMRNKLVELIGDEAYRVGIFTFHSFAENIMKEFSFYFKDSEHLKVISDLDKVKILEKIIDSNNLKELISSFDPFSSLKQIKGAIDDIKKEGINPIQFLEMIPKWEKELLSSENLFYKRNHGKYKKGDIKPTEKEKIDKKINKAKELAKIFSDYQKENEKSGFYDFSDMILNVLKELEENENLKLDLQEKYQYLLIDEHQDTNDGQNKLIELLTDAKHLNGKPNLFTVGDEKQSIYRFQGASEKTFKHFEEIYKNIEKIFLEDNYRSTKNILDASHDLISRTIKDSIKLKSFKKENDSVKILEFTNYKFELLYITEEIKKRIKGGVDPAEIAVIYRSNKHIVDIRNIFNQEGIPHTVLSKDDILEDKNIDNLVTILRVINNLNDNHNLGKSLLINFLNFDSYEAIKVLSEFRKINRKENKNLFEILSERGDFKDFTEKIKNLKKISVNVSFLTFFKKFLEELGYLDFMLGAKDSRDQLVKLDKLFDEIKRQVQNTKGYSLDDFIKFIDSYKKYELNIEVNNPEIIEGVKLMTAHKSKGLEFEQVYMINTTSRNWEKNRGFPKIALPIEDYKGDLDDERRLFYVAMTRAKNGLCISSSSIDWEGKDQEKSQFITEIDEKFTETPDVSKFEKEHIENLSIFMRDIDLNKSIWDKEYLKKLFLEKSLSVTGLNNYLDCPIKYLFRSLIQLPSEYSSTLLFGNLIHGALEKFFNDSASEKKVLKKEVLLSYFKEGIDASNMYDKEYERHLEKGENALSNYYDKYNKDWILDIETEKYIKRQYELKPGDTINLSGILDKIEYIDFSRSKINIIDYKTGKAFTDKTQKNQKEDLRRQIIFYHILMEGYENGEVRINEAVLDFIEENKKNEFERHSIKVLDSDIREVKDEINKTASEILSGEFLEKGCDKKDCEYCKLIK